MSFFQIIPIQLSCGIAPPLRCFHRTNRTRRAGIRPPAALAYAIYFHQQKGLRNHESNRNRKTDRRPGSGRHPQGDPPYHADPRGGPDTDIIDTRYPILVRNHGYFQKIWSGSRGLIHHAEGRKPPPKSKIAVSIEAAILHTSRGKLCTAVS